MCVFDSRANHFVLENQLGSSSLGKRILLSVFFMTTLHSLFQCVAAFVCSKASLLSIARGHTDGMLKDMGRKSRKHLNYYSSLFFENVIHKYNEYSI